MRVVVLIDRRFADCEHALVSRLTVGLADEGVRVALIWPERVSDAARPDVLAPVIGTDLEMRPPLSWLAPRVLRRRLKEIGYDSFDIVHAFGGSTWRAAAQLAASRNAVLALEVWRSGLAHRVRTLGEINRRRQSSGRPAAGVLALAPDHNIERELEDGDVGVSVRVAPWGVRTPERPNIVLPPARRRGIVIAGNGRDARLFSAAFEATLSLVMERDDLMAFVDADAVQRLGLWPRVVANKAESLVTLVAGLETSRAAPLRSDFVVHPEARGERRSLLLGAMAAGALVVAARDDSVEWLKDGQTAKLVSGADAESWRSAIATLLNDRAASERLVASARSYVHEHHRPAAHVAAVLDGYEWMHSGMSRRVAAGAEA